MPRLVITHPVVDIDKWLGFKAERAQAVEGLGVTNVVDHVAGDGSNMVALSCDVADVNAIKATLASPSPEMAALMEKHGVLAPMVAYLEG